MRALAIILAAAAAAFLVTGRLYHVVEHPEWTEAQALIELWLVWTVGSLLAVSAVCVSIAGSALRK